MTCVARLGHGSHDPVVTGTDATAVNTVRVTARLRDLAVSACGAGPPGSSRVQADSWRGGPKL
jgi:hypothetical protein